MLGCPADCPRTPTIVHVRLPATNTTASSNRVAVRDMGKTSFYVLRIIVARDLPRRRRRLVRGPAGAAAAAFGRSISDTPSSTFRTQPVVRFSNLFFHRDLW